MSSLENEYPIDLKDIEIKIKILDPTKSQVLARAEIKFGKIIAIKGFKITKSKYGNYFVAPPSYLSKGKYHNIIWIGDKELWTYIQQKIIEKYKPMDIKEYCENYL